MIKKKKNLWVGEICGLQINIQRRAYFVRNKQSKKKRGQNLDNRWRYCRKFHEKTPYYSSRPIFDYKNIKKYCLCRFCIQILHCLNSTTLFIKTTCNSALYCRYFKLIFLLVSHKIPYHTEYLSANRSLFDPYIIFITFYFLSGFLIHPVVLKSILL